MTARKVILSEFLTLDGVIEAPHEWSFPYWSDEIATFKDDELFSAGALLLGRVTYEGFAAAWPSRSGDDYADRINSMPKYVVSTTLLTAGWNNTTIIRPAEGGDVVREIADLKRHPGEDLLVFGSGDLSQTLMRHGLVDRYDLLLYPLVLGRGQRLFAGDNDVNLELVESKPYGSGVVLLTYRPAPDDDETDD